MFQFLTSSEYPLAATVGPSLGAAAGKSRGRTVMPVASDVLETLLNSILRFQHLCGPNYKTQIPMTGCVSDYAGWQGLYKGWVVTGCSLRRGCGWQHGETWWGLSLWDWTAAQMSFPGFSLGLLRGTERVPQLLCAKVGLWLEWHCQHLLQGLLGVCTCWVLQRLQGLMEAHADMCICGYLLHV